jgi:hypothetical protein
MTEDGDLLVNFVPRIKELPGRTELLKADVLVPDLLLGREGDVEVYYAPFHHTNEQARVVMVGITPGWTQTEISFRRTRHYLLAGHPPAEACRLAGQEASFAGQMRRNLITMLSELGVPGHLGISPADLFAPQNYGLLHTTSAIRYPVFVRRAGGWENYNGYTPPLVQDRLLRGYLQTKLAEELGRVRHALVVPLGNSVSAALRVLVRQGILTAGQCLFGFPHPSGGNEHRVRLFTQAKPRLARQVADWFKGASRGPVSCCPEGEDLASVAPGPDQRGGPGQPPPAGCG